MDRSFHTLSEMVIETISSLAEGNPLVVGIELLIGSIYDVDDIKMVRVYYRPQG